jgi:hypothetical protein
VAGTWVVGGVVIAADLVVAVGVAGGVEVVRPGSLG